MFLPSDDRMSGLDRYSPVLRQTDAKPANFIMDLTLENREHSQYSQYSWKSSATVFTQRNFIDHGLVVF